MIYGRPIRFHQPCHWHGLRQIAGEIAFLLTKENGQTYDVWPKIEG